MANNEELYPPPPQVISNVFAAADLSSRSSSDSDKYKCAWLKAKEMRTSILSAWECTDTCSKALSIALNHKENTSFMAVTSAILPKQYANAITQYEQKKKYCPMQHQLVINENKEKTDFFVISNIVSMV